MIGMMTQLPCTQTRPMAAAAGAIAAYAGLGSVLPAPPIVHYALAGVAVDMACRSTNTERMRPNLSYVEHAVYGAVGAYASGMLLGRSYRMY